MSVKCSFLRYHQRTSTIVMSLSNAKQMSIPMILSFLSKKDEGRTLQFQKLSFVEQKM